MWNLASYKQKIRLKNTKTKIMTQNRLFYNPKNPLIFQSKKSTSTFLSARDKFILEAQTSDIFNYYTDTLKYNFLYVEQEGGRGYNSKPYFIT
jgi:hypothetical protein